MEEPKKEDINTSIESTPKKKSFIKKFLKVVLYIFFGLIGLNVLLFILLSIPSIQQKAADFAVNELKKTLNTEVSIDKVRLKLFNHATLEGIYIEDQAKDTLLYAQNLDVSLSPWEFIKSNKLAITGIDINDFIINVNQKDSISDFNFQFIIDAFSSPDTTVVDTTKSSLIIVIEDINLRNGRLNYDILADTLTPGIFNASHISLYDVNINLDLNSIDTDKFDIALNKLAAKERSGIEIKNLKGHMHSDKDQLWVDGLSLYLPDSRLITNNARYNLATGEFEVGTEDTEMEPMDLVAFLPNLKFLDKKISLNTNIKGTLPEINIQNLNLTYGEDFYLNGNARLASYERYGTSDISLSIDKAKASPSAVTAFARLGDSTFVSPDILKDMGDIFLTGKLTGQLNKFRLDAEAWCRQGSLNMLATGGVDTTFTNFDVTAGLKTHNFNLGQLLGPDTGLGRLAANVNLKARQTEKEPLNAQVQGRIESLGFNQETMKNLPFEAYYNAQEMGVSAKADWNIGKLEAKASMSQDNVPDINVHLRVDTMHVDYFYKNDAWINPRLSMVLDGKIKGLDIDNMTGTAAIDSLHFFAENFDFKPGKFTLEAGKNEEDNKFINFNSSLLTANIAGQYSFMILSDEMSHVLYNYLPAVFPHEHKGHRSKEQNDFTFNITSQNTEELSRIFELPVEILKPASINGHINTIANQIKIDANVPSMRFGEYDIENTTLNVFNLDSAFSVTAESRILMEQGNYNLSMLIDGAQNNLYTDIGINSDNTAININGGIESLVQFFRNESDELVSTLKISPSTLNVEKLSLNLLPAEIMNVGQRTEIKNFGLGVNNKRYFGVDGVISDQKTDSLNAYFDHAEIGTILEAFDVKNIRGLINGNILLTNLLAQPEVYTKGLEMADIVIFSDTLGTLNLESAWSNEFGGARLNALLEKDGEDRAELDGTIYTRQDSLDLQLRLTQMPLKWTQPFVADMLNKLDGSMSTNLIIEGSTKAPKVRGFLGFNNTQIGVDYTNVVYTISDTIRISPDRIGFENLTVRDSEGNTAIMNATVTHRNFEDMKYTLNAQLNNLMVLNTENRTDSLFYGRVFTSGTVRIDGDDNGIDMTMQVRNEKNSRLNILLPQHSEASDYKSVVYINVPEEKLRAEQEAAASPIEKPLPLKLKVKLDVNSDILLGVIIDPVTGDEMQARGSGTIDFSYDMVTENMAAYGDYTLSNGFVKLNLQGLKKLDFQIKEGSKLYFSGDPLKTRFDITAYRRVRANPNTLDNTLQSGRIDVDCILEISGNMDKMDVAYNISLPNANDDIMTQVNSLISTDEQKTMQFASLVATGSFYSSMGGVGSGFGSGLWTGLASSTLSKGLSSLVGSMLGDGWQVGANIESEDGTFNEMDMSVNVSRKFLDDKLKFSTNVGYRTGQTTNSGNDFIGDFDLEYELNSMWTLRAYSHTNDRYYKQAETTQGIGIVYSKEAATLKRLFQSFRPRRRSTNNQEQSQQQQNQQAEQQNQQIEQQTISNTTPVKPIPSDSTQVKPVQQPIINNKED